MTVENFWLSERYLCDNLRVRQRLRKTCGKFDDTNDTKGRASRKMWKTRPLSFAEAVKFSRIFSVLTNSAKAFRVRLTDGRYDGHSLHQPVELLLRVTIQSGQGKGRHKRRPERLSLRRRKH